MAEKMTVGQRKMAIQAEIDALLAEEATIRQKWNEVKDPEELNSFLPRLTEIGRLLHQLEMRKNNITEIRSQPF